MSQQVQIIEILNSIHEEIRALSEFSVGRKWADARTCREIYGLNRNVLNHWAELGLIRKCKTTDAAVAGALYRCVDIEEVMEFRSNKGV